jgi:hypothetical protein
VTDSSLTLSFTEVNDGTGQPASYDFRYAVGAISWGSAAEVTRGSCASPVAGSVIGAKRSCTVLGLAASTGYQVQVIAFRGTVNVNAVFGALSNVAGGTAPVASVVVSPATASVAVGQMVQLTATPKDARGNSLSGRVVTWATSNAALATVSGSGLVSGLVVGSVTITATSEGQSGTAAVMVTALPPPPSGGTWPNEPAGMTLLSDYGMDQPIPTSGDVPIAGSGGWHVVSNAPPGSSGGWTTLGSDAGAPLSPPSVYQAVYPVGMKDGGAPGTVYWASGLLNQCYFGFWWKPSNPWQGDPSGTNKIAFGFVGGSTIFLSMHGAPGGPYHLQVQDEMGGNVNYDGITNITLGQWYRIEWYFSYPGSGTSGTMQLWLGDATGKTTLEIATSVYLPGPISMVQFSPTWGGNVGAVKTEQDMYEYDHVHLSTK